MSEDLSNRQLDRLHDLRRFTSAEDVSKLIASLKRHSDLLYALAADARVGKEPMSLEAAARIDAILGEDRPVRCPDGDTRPCPTCNDEEVVPEWKEREWRAARMEAESHE